MTYNNNTRYEAQPVKVAWVAYGEAPAEIVARAEEYIRQLLPAGSYVITVNKPDIILFMSGGSERRALSLTEPGHPVLLLSVRGNNAYAAATEVMAWMNDNNRHAILSDAQEAFETGLLTRWLSVVRAWDSLRGKKAGLIGNVSDWLVTTDDTSSVFEKTTGLILRQIPWNTITDYSMMEPDSILSSRFKETTLPGLDDASRVLTALRHTIASNNLDAIAVECFSLVRKRGVTACLALAQLNTEGFVAACEGDLVAMAGMMTVKAATGMVPWMANTTCITGNKLLLSHCTVAFDSVKDIRLATHYETDCSLAVKSIVPATDVTLFRFSGSLYKAFIAEGRVTDSPSVKDACRTQAEIELPQQAVQILRERPLGNHLLMIPGKFSEYLKIACYYKGIEVQK